MTFFHVTRLTSACYSTRTPHLFLAANEDEDYLRQDRDYRNLSFLITTGPGPVPSLDGENIVFGQVIGAWAGGWAGRRFWGGIG